MPKQYLYVSLFVLLAACSSKKDAKESLSTPVVHLLAGDVERGKLIYTTCTSCHGTNGEGNQKMNGPALVNTDYWYLYRQLMNFKKDVRGGSSQDSLSFQMAAMAKTLKDSIAAIDVVAYIKSLPVVNLTSSIAGDVEKGKRIYESICGSCHGPGASGNEKLNAPRLNGLEDWYIERQIYNFKNSVRGTHPQDKLGAQMIPMMTLLPNDESVKNVIAYIRSTSQTPM